MNRFCKTNQFPWNLQMRIYELKFMNDYLIIIEKYPFDVKQRLVTRRLKVLEEHNGCRKTCFVLPLHLLVFSYVD